MVDMEVNNNIVSKILGTSRTLMANKIIMEAIITKIIHKGINSRIKVIDNNLISNINNNNIQMVNKIKEELDMGLKDRVISQNLQLKMNGKV